MNDFEKFAFDEICTVLGNVDTRVDPDIYALSFFVFEIDDDPRYPVLQVGYNTLAQANACASSASSAEEAKWNFAFWLQNELKFIGEPGTQAGMLLEDHLKARGLWYSDEEEAADFEQCMQMADRITACFVEACVRIVQALHASGVIERKFSKPIPILVHELEYYEEIAMQTQRANPSGLAKEFENWIASM
ncbi:hypothetical protein GM658_18135 [Pseudoduganella eburnea]|uniref:DUF4303 domain-containing protein n=1 Tax=Massilia eburnea TaxID=1776165 RepID=A0A6L6QK39_9BURK|nr:hypothetical protein [Massilia eburnea]MTW12531.1 hypothetical protein [Massilia eburnea]